MTLTATSLISLMISFAMRYAEAALPEKMKVRDTQSASGFAIIAL